MVDEIEISPSNHKARCVICEKFINRLEIRGKKSHTKSHPEYTCEKCLIKEVENLDDNVKEIKGDLSKFLKMNNEAKEDFLNRLKILKKLK